jgi:hypothetical protein
MKQLTFKHEYQFRNWYSYITTKFNIKVVEIKSGHNGIRVLFKHS